jgi:hypothetical protein
MWPEGRQRSLEQDRDRTDQPRLRPEPKRRHIGRTIGDLSALAGWIQSQPFKIRSDRAERNLMTVSRLRDIPGIGVDQIGDAADAANDGRFLRLENLDTDLPPPAIAREVTHDAIDDDAANSYLPFQGH